MSKRDVKSRRRRPELPNPAATPESVTMLFQKFYDGLHKFDRAMQRSAFAHFERWLRE
jgi:hypothetical protein